MCNRQIINELFLYQIRTTMNKDSSESVGDEKTVFLGNFLSNWEFLLKSGQVKVELNDSLRI